MYQLQEPLNRLLMKNRKWVWSLECKSVIEDVGVILYSDLLLTHFSPELVIVVPTDAAAKELEWSYSTFS